MASGLARFTNDVELMEDGSISYVTWRNHIPGRHNAGSSFTKLNQYVSIYESGAYHCILFDGSIVRASFKFEKNLLIQENLMYWPAPLTVPEDEVDELGIRDAIDMRLLSLNSNSEALNMRTPFRIDYDLSNANDMHPETHLHIQHSDCRISVNKPICFNTFIRFIISNFYPYSQQSVVDRLGTINYSGYKSGKEARIVF